jgi:TPR repeat protein
MLQLADTYVNGDGIKKTIPEAIRLYQMAIKLHHLFAQRNVDLLYRQTN